MGYDPENPMKDRITDIGPPHYEQVLPAGHQEQLRQMALS